MDKELKNKNFIDAVKNACSGIFYAFKTQINIKIQLVVAVLVLILGLYFKISKIELLFVIGAIFLVIITETINTAIETCVDLVTNKYNIKAKIAKDVAAGAVLLSAINAVIIGIIIFGDKILNIFS